MCGEMSPSVTSNRKHANLNKVTGAGIGSLLNGDTCNDLHFKPWHTYCACISGRKGLSVILLPCLLRFEIQLLWDLRDSSSDRLQTSLVSSVSSVIMISTKSVSKFYIILWVSNYLISSTYPTLVNSFRSRCFPLQGT